MAQSKELNINISQAALDQIVEEVGNRTTEQLKNIGDDGQLLLKKVSLDFVQEVQKNLEKIQEAERNALLLKQKRDSIGYSKNKKDQAVVEEYQKYKKEIRAKNLSDYTFDEFFIATMKFNDEILQIITGHEARIAIVIPSAEDGSPPFILDIPLSEMFAGDTGITVEADITSGKIPRLSGRLKFNIEQMKNHFSEALRQDTIIDSVPLRGLNEAYNTAILDYRKHKPLAFWTDPTESKKTWLKITIKGAQGDISEAYAYFFYTGEQEGNLFLGSIYNANLHHFFTKGVANVDNISGLYTSDVSTKQYDYAVKSADASLPGFRQMLDLAVKILNGKIKTVSQLKEISLKKQFKDYIHKTGAKGLRNEVTRATKEELKQYLNG